MPPSTPRERYAREVDNLIRAQYTRVGVADEVVRSRVRAVLEDLRRTLSRIPDRDFTVATTRQIMAGLERSMQGLTADLSAEYRLLVDDTVTNGIAKILDPMAVAGFPDLPPVDISQNLVNTSARYTAGLINDDVAPAALSRINGILRRSAMGGLPPADAIAQIGSPQLLPGSGPFASLSSRATTIYRTESLRMYSIVSEQQLQASAKVVPGMKKMWLHTGIGVRDPRRTHQNYSRTVVGLNDFFEVAGRPTSRVEKLRFPRDPTGSPDNVINCACTVEEIFPEEGTNASPSVSVVSPGMPPAPDGGFPIP